MTASILDGKIVASSELDALKSKIAKRIQSGITPPGLAVILVGDHPASHLYVNKKREACKRVGMNSFSHDLPETISEQALLELLEGLNNNPEVHGILVQLPLPSHIDKQKVINTIHPNKDVDGFHPYNLGSLAQGNPTLRPCTPYGIMKLLRYYEINPKGMDAVVVGTSNIVGKPMALELLHAKATITICHRQTKQVEKSVQNAELVVIATGAKDIIPTEYFHDSQVVIDVGIHRDANGLVRGDIDFEAVKEKVAWITPVPGGVGPMTIVTLLENTLKAQGWLS